METREKEHNIEIKIWTDQENMRGTVTKDREKILQTIKTRCMCECGAEFNKHHIARHRKTTKLKQLMEHLCADDQISIEPNQTKCQ